MLPLQGGHIFLLLGMEDLAVRAGKVERPVGCIVCLSEQGTAGPFGLPEGDPVQA